VSRVVESNWIAAFTETFRLCGVAPGESAAVLGESQSRAALLDLAEMALAQLGARVYRVVVPSPSATAPAPVRSTGASHALHGLQPVVAALAGTRFVVDCTVEGLLHAPELPALLAQGSRILMVSNEHPEILERLAPDPALEPKVRAGMRKLKAAGTLRVTSDSGTDLAVTLAGARVGGGWGYTAKPGTIAHWPGGLCLCFPAAGCVNGTLMLAPGDLNLTFKRYLESSVQLTIENDFITGIAGAGVDAQLMKSYLSAWGEEAAYAVSHVGWGMNPAARWDALACYDKNDCNGTEQRAFAGNFLYSTGANEVAGRHTLGHFDLPMRDCTLILDDEVIVRAGVLQGELA
jgi:2,5-dihydroxypyridine 5,6-dioxygenase